MAPAAATLLTMTGIVKRFPGVTALDGVDLDVKRGEVHLLLGENGAGKSTLMKILSGAYRADEGTVALGGAPVDITSPHGARELGIAMMYQELSLVPHLSAAENIFLGREPSRWGFIRRAPMEAEAGRLLRRLRAEFPPSALVRDLPVAHQQLVEIAKALSLRPKLLVMDEPTTALTERETKELFRIIARLRGEGVAVIYITHRLEEARRIGDRVTVLRDGKDVGTYAVKRVSDARLVKLMVGRTLDTVFPPLATPDADPLLEVDGLARDGVLDPVCLEVRSGEILGLAGLIGSGRTELARCLIGADRATAGTVRVAGRKVRIASPRDAKRHGLVLLPEDRKRQGLVLGLPVLHNVSLAALDRVSWRGWLRGRVERDLVGGLIKRLDVRTPGLGQIARNLSGGNQQKLVLAKWLAVEPRVFIFDEPTRGIDVGAKVEVYKLIVNLARQGAAVLFISSDLTEVLGMSHRVGVMRDRRLVGVLPRRAATPEKVMHLAMGLSPV